MVDVNYWKSFLHARLSAALGDPGALTLFDTVPAGHRYFAEHLTAEYRVKTEGRGRCVDEWKIRPEAHDNHWFDGIVGCAVAASMCGCVLAGTDKDTRNNKPRVKVKLSELRKSKNF